MQDGNGPNRKPHSRGRPEYVLSRLDPRLRITSHAGDILFLVSRGSKAREVGSALGITCDTVYEEIESLRKRLGARNMADLIRLAIRHGFVAP